MSELIAPPYAPPAASPYSPGLLTGDWIFLSGQGGFDPDTGELVSDDVADLTAQVFRNVEVLLRAAGASLDDIVSCLVHLSDLAQFAEFNASYAKQFPGPVKPVRTTVGSDLAAGMRVEVTVAPAGQAARPAPAPRRAGEGSVPAAAMPAATRLFLAGNAVAMTGNGLVLAFTLIYLHQARGIALPVVGLLLAAGAAAGLLAVTVSGVLLDWLGARRVLTGIILGQAAAQVLLAWAHNAAPALPALLLYGATWAPMFPAISTVIARLTPDPATQQRVFAINFTAQNAALGVGTVLGAAVANVHHPGSFQALFLANAASCLIFAAVLTFLPTLRTAPAKKERRASYRDVLAHSGLRLALVASLIVAFTGYPAFDSGLPAYASVEAHVSARIVALSLTVNTALIVLAQLFVLRRVRRARRSSALAVSGLILAVSWAVFGLAALPVAATGRIAFVFGFTALFGLGETVLAPTVGPLVNRLTDDRLRGRANSLAALSQSLAFIVCPALATGFIAAGAAAVWIGLLCAGCLGTIAVGARLRRALTSDQDYVTEAPATESEPVAAVRNELGGAGR